MSRLPAEEFSCFSSLDDLHWFRTTFAVVPHIPIDTNIVKEQVQARTQQQIVKTYVLYYHYTSIKPTTVNRHFKKMTQLDSYIYFPDGTVFGRLIHQLSQNLFYNLRISSSVNNSTDNNIHGFTWKRNKNVWDVSIFPERKVEFGYLRKLTGTHSVGGSMSLHPETEENLKQVVLHESDASVSFSAGYKWRSTDNEKIISAQWNSHTNTLLATWIHQYTYKNATILSGFRVMKDFQNNKSAAFLGNSISFLHLPLTFSVRFLSSNKVAFMVEGLYNKLEWNINAMLDSFGSRFHVGLEWPL